MSPSLRADLESRLASLEAIVADPAQRGAQGAQRYSTLHDELDVHLTPAKARLLDAALAWDDQEQASARWLRMAHRRMAVAGYRLCTSHGRSAAADDATLAALLGQTYFHGGESIRWSAHGPRSRPSDFGPANTLMRFAIAAGVHRREATLTLKGRETRCTPEGLYFRGLLFARFASGVLDARRAEILDAWIMEWMSALEATPDAPGNGAALRVDLESREGLRRGPRASGGPSLYLPPDPIRKAYLALRGELQAGRFVPSTGISAGFRIEEHVAVLDLVEAGLRAATSPSSRAPRQARHVPAEMFVGFEEIRRRGFMPVAPLPPHIALVGAEGAATQRSFAHDNALDAIFEVPRRMVMLLDESRSGFGLEGGERECGSLAPGDLVALRIDGGSSLHLARVERCGRGTRGARVVLGVRRLAGTAQPVRLEAVEGDATRAALFVRGEDSSGRQDALLVAERDFGAGMHRLVVDGRAYVLRMTRCRDRGRGWALAGLEVTAIEPRYEHMIA